MATRVNGTVVIDDCGHVSNVGNLTATGTLTTVKINETVVALGNTGTAANINLSAGTVFTATLNNNCTFSVQNPGNVSSFILILTNDGTPSRTVAWSGGSFRFPGGAATLSRTTSVSNTDVWTFFSTNSGATWYGNIATKNLLT